jgi:D-amino-acid dehydrogenase
MSESVTVVGGGLIGLASAYYLRQAGLDVTVLERDRVGSGASRGNAGEICPGLAEPLPAPGVIGSALRTIHRPDSALYLRPQLSADLARFLLRFAAHANRRSYQAGTHALAALAEGTFDLFTELGADVNKAGYLFVFDTLHSARRSHAAFSALGASVNRVLTHAEVRDLEPCVTKGVGFMIDNEWTVDPSSFVDNLADTLRANGVRIVEGARVTSVQAGSVHTSVGDFRSSAVLIAAGIWSRHLCPGLTMFPGKGYSFSVSVPRHPGRLIKLEDAKVACTPMGDRVRIAGTMEFDRDPDRFNPGRVTAIVAAARPYLSDVDWSARTHEWVGARPMTPDGLPVIGPVPGQPRTFVATGHNMLGLALAPTTGRLVADLVTGRPAPLAPLFAPSR